MLSLIIPFYEDAGCSKPFVEELKKELEGIDYELILVDDGSTDTTPRELSELEGGRIKVIYNKENKEFGGAIMAGLNKAKGDILGFSCGDGEVTAKDVVRVYQSMEDSSVVKAIRRNRKDGLIRKFVSVVFNMWSRLRFNLKIDDINGYPVYFKKEIYKELKDLRTDWMFNVDLLRKIIDKGYKIQGVLVMHKKRLDGKSKMTPKRIIKMIFKYIKYN